MDILKIENLKTSFLTDNGTVQAVRDVTFSLSEGEILGIVGESGSGKSVTMLSLMGLLAKNGYMTEGKIEFNGKKILNYSPQTEAKQPELYKVRKTYENIMTDIRGKEIGMIFQDPMTFLNPILTIEYQLTEGLKRHMKLSSKECREKAVELLSLVGISSPEKRLKQYSFELSGGMRQRVMIAMALICNPKLLIADEPTTALDVTIQAQILELIKELKERLNMSVILITHDLGVVASMCTRIMIMYGGQIVETGTDREIFYEGRHPYTWGLLNSVTNPEREGKEKLIPIEGSPPDLLRPPVGCAFVDRCPQAMRICKDYAPPTTSISDTHKCRCWLEQSEIKAKRQEG